MLPDNETVLQRCIENPEQYDDSKAEGRLVITPKRGQSNKLMLANAEILDLITTFKVARDEGDNSLCARIIDKMIPLLQTRGMNYSEFATFWQVNDISYSLYEDFDTETKRTFLTAIILPYIAYRHQIYKEHGYTATTLQVRADSHSHKASGSRGIRKIESILKGFNIPLLTDESEWMSCPSFYILADRRGKNLFDRIVTEMKISFTWCKQHAGKRPDFLIKHGPKILIVEHKHEKEGGGGQDKQIVEISEFISQMESLPDVHYVAFLDGIFFNMLLVNPSGGKSQEQNRQIWQALKENKNNYFVYTYGFNLLIQHLVK